MGQKLRAHAFMSIVSLVEDYMCVAYQNLPVPIGTVNHDGSAVIMRWE